MSGSSHHEVGTRIGSVTAEWERNITGSELTTPLDDVRPELRLGVALIGEACELHYGRSRMNALPTGSTTLLIGDFCFADGLCEIAQTGDVAAISRLADGIAAAVTSDEQWRQQWHATVKELQ